MLKVGEITNAKLLGGYELVLKDASSLPQPLASATVNVFGDRLGAQYEVVYYLGSQVVNGTNYKVIVKRNKFVSGGKTENDFAIVTINIPAGSVGGEGATIVSEEDASDFVLRDELEVGFKKAVSNVLGVEYKPLIEIGEQVVKGMNYFFICEAKVIYPEAQAYLVRLTINQFKDVWTVVEIEQL